MPKIEAVCKIENMADKPTRELGDREGRKVDYNLGIEKFLF